MSGLQAGRKFHLPGMQKLGVNEDYEEKLPTKSGGWDYFNNFLKKK